jgi:propanediol dehydratase large subunit
LPQHAPDLSAALADVIDDTLDDLRAELDARRAVIAAYARLEHVLAAYGAPRHASEAPQEYLERVLVDLEVPRAAVSRLTALFTRAKFSHHEVVATMKDEAIEALETVRDGLREAQERAEAERAHARALARELAAR